MKTAYAGYSLDKNYRRLVVWHFGRQHQLISTATYRYDRGKRGEPPMPKRQRYEMFCKFLGHNKIKPPEYVK